MLQQLCVYGVAVYEFGFLLRLGDLGVLQTFGQRTVANRWTLFRCRGRPVLALVHFKATTLQQHCRHVVVIQCFGLFLRLENLGVLQAFGRRTDALCLMLIKCFGLFLRLENLGVLQAFGLRTDVFCLMFFRLRDVQL